MQLRHTAWTHREAIGDAAGGDEAMELPSSASAAAGSPKRSEAAISSPASLPMSSTLTGVASSLALLAAAAAAGRSKRNPDIV